MFRLNPALAARAACLTLLSGGVACGGEFRPSPPSAGSSLPEPPRQNAPWAAPTVDLPAALVTAVEALFQAGMADPRGCEYRAVEVAVGSCWSGDGGIAPTHGWLLPAKGGDKQRFAVCWNGLVYPVVSAGGAADLKADVLAVVKADEEMRALRAKDDPKNHFYRFRQAWPESESVSYESLLPVKTCLLLRLGEGELARKVWDAWTAGMSPDTDDDAVHLKDPYLMLATDWVWAMFDRAVCAHMRADDHLALVSARALVPMEKAVAAEAEKRGFKPRREATVGAKKDEHPYLDFLAPLPDLLADQERRTKEPKRGPVPPPGKDKGKRIAALILSLDDVSARQGGQPGGVSPGADPTVGALIEEGDAAVEPLLKCLEGDARLTRSVQVGRDADRYRSLLGVHEAAYVALMEVLQTYYFGVAPRDDLSGRASESRRATAAAVRAYWNKFKDVPQEERWYVVLADDKASPDGWLWAATYIVRPVDLSVSPRCLIAGGWVTVRTRAPGEKPKLRGEVLRAKKNPSVTELMGKRIESLRQTDGPVPWRMQSIVQACSLAKILSEWDEKAALPHLRRLVRECRDCMSDEKLAQSKGWTFRPLAPEIGRLTLLRVKAGDAAALDEYAGWVSTIGPDAQDFSFKDVLQPMWENPTHPAVAAAARMMFNDEQSPWTRKFLRAYNTHDLAETPMLGVAGFRERLLVELTDKEKAGSITLYENGCASTELDGGYGSSGGDLRCKDDPLAPKPWTPVPFRVCDYYAFELSLHDGLPRCPLYWPLEKRDRAVADCAKLLRRYGERFQYSALQDSLWTLNDRARMTFPPLDHPATADEVKKGLAIFSLEGEGKTRSAGLSARPMKARWTTLKDSPYGTNRYDPKTKKTETTINYDQEGLVWQAEEVLKEGKWERYYGFVGANRVARVPAAEIEFPPAEPRR